MGLESFCWFFLLGMWALEPSFLGPPKLLLGQTELGCPRAICLLYQGGILHSNLGTNVAAEPSLGPCLP